MLGLESSLNTPLRCPSPPGRSVYSPCFETERLVLETQRFPNGLTFSAAYGSILGQGVVDLSGAQGQLLEARGRSGDL